VYNARGMATWSGLLTSLTLIDNEMASYCTDGHPHFFIQGMSKVVHQRAD